MSCKADVQKRGIEAAETCFCVGAVCTAVGFLGSILFSKDEVEVGVKKGDSSLSARGKNKY